MSVLRPRDTGPILNFGADAQSDMAFCGTDLAQFGHRKVSGLDTDHGSEFELGGKRAQI